MSSTGLMKDKILSAAEKRVRLLGFNAVSFRDVADDVGIKSASIHYHFPKKEDLGVSLIERYSARFVSQMNDIDIDNLDVAITDFVKLYGDALKIGEQVCLCAILGAETNGLSPLMKEKVGLFFSTNIDWLAALQLKHGLSEPRLSPSEIIAMLEGAMILSTAMGSRQTFETVAERICNSHKPRR